MENVDSTMYLHPPSCMGGKSHHSFCRPAGSHSLKSQNNMKKLKLGCLNLLTMKTKLSRPPVHQGGTSSITHPDHPHSPIHQCIQLSIYHIVYLFIHLSFMCVSIQYPSIIHQYIQPRLHPSLCPTIYL